MNFALTNDAEKNYLIIHKAKVEKDLPGEFQECVSQHTIITGYSVDTYKLEQSHFGLMDNQQKLKWVQF